VYEVNGSAGYIAGYEANVEGGATQYLNSFHYVIRKESDGKWRISSEIFTLNSPPVPKAATAEQLIKHLDAEGIKRAVVLSTAFWYGSVFRKSPDDEYGKVRAENDWVALQVTSFPNRLIGFCSFNPLKEYALEELNRCAKNPNLKGLKLHFGNSGVDVTNPQHVEKVSQIFRAANDKGIPIVVHLWIVGKYGREHSEAFLNKILPAAPDIPIQIAHMAASGPSYHSDDALEVFANACVSGDRRMKNVYFDVASMVTRDTPQATLELVAKRIRQLGIRHVLYGSDRAGTSEDRSRGTWDWTAFHRLPLTAEEFRAIASNIAPFMR
jgi:predicted TIM-barrel fold metal-dependent hydrolase